MMDIDDISEKTGVRGQKKDTWKAKKKERKREKEREGKKIGNDVSALGQLPRLLIKSADG